MKMRTFHWLYRRLTLNVNFVSVVLARVMVTLGLISPPQLKTRVVRGVAWAWVFVGEFLLNLRANTMLQIISTTPTGSVSLPYIQETHTERETWLYRYSGTSLVILLQKGQLFFSSCRQFNPWKKDTSLIRTLSSVQQVSIIGSHSEFCKHLNVLADDFKDPGEGCVFARDCDVDTRDGDSSCHFHCNLIAGDHPHRTTCGL